MIPKKLFFIWFGNNIPNYVNYTIEKFKQVNKNFDINLIHRSCNDIENIFYNNICHDYIDNVIKTHCDIIYNKMIKEKINRPFLIRLLDSCRVSIVKKTGGIYCDCDMFPIKPFDDELLCNECFRMKRIHLIRGRELKELIEDGFFGCSKMCDYSQPKIIGCIEEFRKTDEMQKMFDNCTLEYGYKYSNNNLNYVEHYGHWSWNPKKCQVNQCKIDLDIKKYIDQEVNFV